MITGLQYCINFETDNMTIRIHKVDSSPAVQGVLMTAELIKLNYEPVKVDFMGGEHLTPA